MNVEERVRAIVGKQLGVQAAEVLLAASFTEDLGADSLDSTEIVMACEEAFHIKVPNEDAESITTIGAAVEYIQQKTGLA